MDEHTSHELAYKKGYEKGKQDAMKWVSVKERLPNERRWVLVYTDVGRTLVAVRYGTEWCSTSFVSLKNVTHWMPLPEPPKGE